MNEKPSVEFLSGIKQAGFALPEFLEFSETKNLAQRKLGRLRPWAWEPDSVELFEPIFGNLTGEKRTAAGSFNPDIARLTQKRGSAALLGKILVGRAALPRSPYKEAVRQHRPTDEIWLCTENEAGVAVNSLDEALAAIATIRQRWPSQNYHQGSTRTRGQQCDASVRAGDFGNASSLDSEFAHGWPANSSLSRGWNANWIFPCNWKCRTMA